MPFAQTRRHEHLNGLAEKLVAREAEEPFGFAVHEHDAAAGIRDHDCGRGTIEEGVAEVSRQGDSAHW